MILMITAFPFAILWLLCHLILQKKQKRRTCTKQYEITLSQSLEGELLFITKITIAPMIFLLGFIISIIICPDIHTLWMIMLALNFLCFAGGMIIMMICTIEEDKLKWISFGIVCIPCEIIVISFGVVIGNIVVSLLWLLMMIKLFDDIVLWLINWEEFTTWFEWRERLKWENEYLRYREGLKVFKSRQREILMMYLGDVDVVNVCFEYLDALEQERPDLYNNRDDCDVIIFANYSYRFMNDCDVIKRIYGIQMDYVRKYELMRGIRNL